MKIEIKEPIHNRRPFHDGRAIHNGEPQSAEIRIPYSFSSDREIRNLICELCRIFYQKGWASGTGGGISIREGNRIFMAPSSVQKERIRPEDLFVLDLDGNILERPKNELLKVSECKPLFMHAYKIRNAGAVLHSHSIHAMLSTWLYNTHFRISNLEMQKGISGTGAFDTLEVPIIPNTATEHQLSDSLKQAILENPKTYAVLVRGHGVYVWGKDWVQAKTHAECYDYLFEAAVKLKQLEIKFSQSQNVGETHCGLPAERGLPTERASTMGRPYKNRRSYCVKRGGQIKKRA